MQGNLTFQRNARDSIRQISRQGHEKRACANNNVIFHFAAYFFLFDLVVIFLSVLAPLTVACLFTVLRSTYVFSYSCFDYFFFCNLKPISSLGDVPHQDENSGYLKSATLPLPVPPAPLTCPHHLATKGKSYCFLNEVRDL